MFYFQHHFPLPCSVLVRFPQGLYLITARGAKRLLCSTCVCLNMINTCLIWKGSTEMLTCSWFHFHYAADQMHKNYSRLIQQKHKVHLTHRERGGRWEGGRERESENRKVIPDSKSGVVWQTVAWQINTIHTRKGIKEKRRFHLRCAGCHTCVLTDSTPVPWATHELSHHQYIKDLLIYFQETCFFFVLF